jgi:hypothetical protein
VPSTAVQPPISSGAGRARPARSPTRCRSRCCRRVRMLAATRSRTP